MGKLALVMSCCVAACGGAVNDDCPIGVIGCACTAGGACDPGLDCVSNVCIDSRELENRGPLDEAAYGDWPDCFASCSNPYDIGPFTVSLTGLAGETVFTANGSVYDTLTGEIDGGSHVPGFGYDVDMFRVRIPPRKVVEIQVRAAMGSTIDPYVSTYDPELVGISPFFGFMTQNDDAQSGTTDARTVIGTPLGDNDPWLVVVDDARNVAGSAAAGGANYGYEVTFRTVGNIEFSELDISGPDRTASMSGLELQRAGDIHYFRFVDPLHRSYVVTFSTSQAGFCGHVWQVDLQGIAAWLAVGANDDAPGDGCDSSLSFQTAAAVYENGSDAYGFLVTDYLGRGSNLGSGDYTYSITVAPAD